MARVLGCRTFGTLPSLISGKGHAFCMAWTHLSWIQGWAETGHTGGVQRGTKKWLGLPEGLALWEKSREDPMPSKWYTVRSCNLYRLINFFELKSNTNKPESWVMESGCSWDRLHFNALELLWEIWMDALKIIFIFWTFEVKIGESPAFSQDDFPSSWSNCWISTGLKRPQNKQASGVTWWEVTATAVTAIRGQAQRSDAEKLVPLGSPRTEIANQFPTCFGVFLERKQHVESVAWQTKTNTR